MEGNIGKVSHEINIRQKSTKVNKPERNHRSEKPQDDFDETEHLKTAYEEVLSSDSLSNSLKQDQEDSVFSYTANETSKNGKSKIAGGVPKPSEFSLDQNNSLQKHSSVPDHKHSSSDRTETNSDGTETNSDGTETNSDRTKTNSGRSKTSSDGTKTNSDGTETNSDGTDSDSSELDSDSDSSTSFHSYSSLDSFAERIPAVVIVPPEAKLNAESSGGLAEVNFFIEDKTTGQSGTADGGVTRNALKKQSRSNPQGKDREECGSSSTPKMGSGASRDGEVVEEDPQYAQRSMAPISGNRLMTGSSVQSPVKQKSSSNSRNLSRSLTPGLSKSMMQSSYRLIDGYEDAVVKVTRDGFSMQELEIMEGQVVTFRWEEDMHLKIIQVVSDGEKLRPVIGGYQAVGSECRGVLEQQFNLEGDYKFAVYGQRCTPLTVFVNPRTDLQTEVTDDGFKPDIIYIDQGHAVKWLWKNCVVPHTVQEVLFCIDRGCFKKQQSDPRIVSTVSGSYRHQFTHPGMYYFQTENKELGKSMCIVHVREAQREHKIEVLDRYFKPMILLIEQGDRVWWYWDRNKCKKPHSVYQIDPPTEDQGDDLFVPTKDGFRWSVPSKQGFLAHEFHHPGVFYFSDQNFEETAEYIGTVIVKPKQTEHFIELKQKGFSPDLVYAHTGDRVWWTWDGEAIVSIQENLLILEDDKCLNPVARKPSAEDPDLLQVLDQNSATLLTKVGMATTNFTTIGVYHYRIADTGDTTSCSIIVNPGPKNHTIHVTDNGFEPKVLTVRPNDRVWWVWQSGKKQHNIIQVSHQGVPINNGFHSGQTRDSPSAFQFQFVTPGVYYFISTNLPKIFGAIVVSTQPQVHEIAVSSQEIKPDPVTIQINDIVCWVFRGPRSHGVVNLETVDQLLDAQFLDKTIAPRRCIAEAIRKPGTFHFYSKSFQSRKKSQNQMDESRMSSVICDERFDNAVIRINKRGFHPSQLYLQKGQSVLWTWKGTDEEHNVIHVNSSDSEQPLNIIQGAQSFNSGKPVPNNSFLYTFDENGSFTVASQGAPGYSCTVTVLDIAPRASEPFIKSEQDGGTVSRNERVYLDTETEAGAIFYTTDGTAPAEHSLDTKKYKPDQGVILKESGLCFIRAITVADGHLTSHIFTSKRFWVLKDIDGDEEKASEESGEEQIEDKRPSSGKQWNWWNCKPNIKGCFTTPGVMEIFWELPPDSARSLVKGYQVFLNGVSYCDMFPRNNNSVNISGLAGGRVYDVHVEAYPSNPSQSTVVSNKLKMKCPLVNPDGGPVISLEVSEKVDSLSIVWMSIDTEERPVEGYIVYLNDQQCGPKLVPDPDSNRCKVVIGSCDLHKTYKIHIMAVFRHSDHTRMSNVLEVSLPLDTSQITKPPPNKRCNDDEMYMEFIEVHEGSGYLPEMDAQADYQNEDAESGQPTQRTPAVLLDASTRESGKAVQAEDEKEKIVETDPMWRKKTKTEKDKCQQNELNPKQSTGQSGKARPAGQVRADPGPADSESSEESSQDSSDSVLYDSKQKGVNEIIEKGEKSKEKTPKGDKDKTKKESKKKPLKGAKDRTEKGEKEKLETSKEKPLKGAKDKIEKGEKEKLKTSKEKPLKGAKDRTEKGEKEKLETSKVKLEKSKVIPLKVAKDKISKGAKEKLETSKEKPLKGAKDKIPKEAKEKTSGVTTGSSGESSWSDSQSESGESSEYFTEASESDSSGEYIESGESSTEDFSESDNEQGGTTRAGKPGIQTMVVPKDRKNLKEKTVPVKADVKSQKGKKPKKGRRPKVDNDGRSGRSGVDSDRELGGEVSKKRKYGDGRENTFDDRYLESGDESETDSKMGGFMADIDPRHRKNRKQKGYPSSDEDEDGEKRRSKSDSRKPKIDKGHADDTDMKKGRSVSETGPRKRKKQKGHSSSDDNDDVVRGQTGRKHQTGKGFDVEDVSSEEGSYNSDPRKSRKHKTDKDVGNMSDQEGSYDSDSRGRKHKRHKIEGEQDTKKGRSLSSTDPRGRKKRRHKRHGNTDDEEDNDSRKGSSETESRGSKRRKHKRHSRTGNEEDMDSKKKAPDGKGRKGRKHEVYAISDGEDDRPLLKESLDTCPEGYKRRRNKRQNSSEEDEDSVKMGRKHKGRANSSGDEDLDSLKMGRKGRKQEGRTGFSDNEETVTEEESATSEPKDRKRRKHKTKKETETSDDDYDIEPSKGNDGKPRKGRQHEAKGREIPEGCFDSSDLEHEHETSEPQSGKRKRHRAGKGRELDDKTFPGSDGLARAAADTEEIPQKASNRVVEVETRDGHTETPTALKKKSLRSYANHDEYLRAQKEGSPKTTSQKSLESRPPNRRFSFYSVGLLILNFISQEKRLQKGVAPRRSSSVCVNWPRLKRFFAENKPAPRMDSGSRRHPTVSLTVPSPERHERRRPVEYDEGYDHPEYDDEDNCDDEEEQYRRGYYDHHDYRRRGSFDRGDDDYEIDDPRMDRESHNRPHTEDFEFENPRHTNHFPRSPDYRQARPRPQKSLSRSLDHRRQRSYSRSPDQSSQSYASPRSRNRSYSPPPRQRFEPEPTYQSKKRDLYANSQSQRSWNSPRNKRTNVPIYNEDESEDSDDFGSDDAEHLYRAPRHVSGSRSFDLDERQTPKGVTFSFDQSEDPDYLYDEDSFYPLPSSRHQPSSGYGSGRERNMPKKGTPRYRSDTNLKSILKNSNSFQDDDDFEDCDTPPPTCGGMLHRYLDMFQNIPHPDVSVCEEDQCVMTDDNYEKATQTPRTGRSMKLIGRRNHLSGEVDYIPVSLHQGETSSSESEADSEEAEDDSELDDNRDRNVVVLDVAKSQSRDYSDRLGKRGKKKKRGQQQQQQDDEDEEHVVPSRPLGKPPTGKVSKPSNAIVEVQQVVELDVTQREVTAKGDIIESHKLAVPVTKAETMKQVGEGEFVLGSGDGVLPAPSIMVESHGKHGVKVTWKLPRQPDPEYQLILYVVNVVGTKFTSEINSDISFECNLVEKDKHVRGVQHCWNIQGKEKCAIKGLVAGLTYRIYVIANYNLMHGQQPCEVQTSSSVIYYTTLGPPKPPKVKVVSVDLYQACIEWAPPAVHSDMKLKGFQIYVDNKPLGGVRSRDVQQMIVNNMIPGKTISVYVVAVTSRANQESEPSKTIHLSCPRRPPPVLISQQPSYKKGCVLVAWDKPHNFVSNSNEEAIALYSIYVDGRWHGEVKSNRMCDQQGYQFFLTDLSPGSAYDISVKAISGTRHIDTEAQHVFCLSDSGMSNTLSVVAPAAPKSPKLRLEGLHPDGIDVTWQVPQQFGDACISGYQMLKNGKLYGSIIPPDVNSLRIRDVSLGEKISLQLIALTEHPVGKDSHQALDAEKDSGIDAFSQPEDKAISDIFSGDRYTGCKPGQSLVVHYTGLVQAPIEVWCEMVSGHSALIVWNTEHHHKAHFVHPDCYQVTWWPGDTAQDDINSDSTAEDHLLITNLRPCTAYTVIVEARKMEKYTDIDEGSSLKETPDGLNAFILTAKSEQLAIKTASPPDPPRNLGVIATTCNSLRVAWDPPIEHGVEVIGIHLQCISLNTSDPHHINVDVMPDSKDANIENLHEKTDYLIRIIAVTEEYFDRLPDRHRHKRLHAIPKDTVISPDDSPWLPNASVLAKTAGTEPPANLKVVKSTRTSLTLSWTPPLVYSSNKLQSQIVRWADLKRNFNKDEDLVVASHVNLLATEDSLVIEDLAPGVQYRIVVEAVVSIKTSLDPDKWDSGIEKYRRTAHIMSAPLLARTRAPIDPPQVLLSSYTQNTANLYWEKPQLMSLVGKDEEGNPEYLRRYLEGYKLEVNGKLQCCLGPSAQSCTLTKCRPGKVYEVALVAMTCTEEVKKQRKQKYKGFFKNTDPQDLDYTALLQDEEDLDESPSDPVEVVLPRHQDGFLATLSAEFEYQPERDNKTFGDVIVSWTCQGGHANLLKQFSIIWYCQDDRVIQTKYVNPEQSSCTIPITRIKSVYNITVEPVYHTDVIAQTIQGLQIMIPGPPDAPEIFLKSVDPEEFIIEWGEPRLFGGIKIKAYQVYLNDKKAGNELSSSHRKAVVPCRANRTYKVNLVALSSNPQFGDSPKSNTLLINTATGSPRPGDSLLEDMSSFDDHEIPLKITKVTENSISLEWSGFLDTEGVEYYKIQWSSVAQPAQREVRLSQKDSNCVINKCLPGTTHFVRLVACKDDGQVVDKSKQLTIQTSAPPDAPIVSVRACNFRYIAVQWDKATTYGEALVTGYKVYVNGIVEAVLNKDQLNYTYTHGKWCHEYSFQVQALTANERLNSKPSEPLIIAWPGAKPPGVYRIPSVSSSSLRVGWEAPYMTEGVKVKHYKLCCVEEDTEKVIQSVGPIHPDTREAEFKHLKKGNYCVYLEVHLYGTSDVVRSDMIRMQPALSPDPPRITVTIVGLEERRQLEKFTCDLVNKRDRLIRAVGHKLKKIGALSHPVRAEKSEDVILGAHTLTRVEETLEDCFNALENYTGQLVAHVSWQCLQSNPDMLVTGYKVLIDGKQYGNAMHSGIKTIRIKLGLEQPSYKLAMVSLSDKPQGTSEESNIVELLSTPFKPFAFYCYHAIHNKDKVWPQYGCCKFQDSIGYERQVGKKLANQGLLLKHVPPPSCSLLDIFDGEFKPLMGFHNRQHPTILLFWTPWCLASGNMMTHFTRFARDNSKEVNIIAVTCGMTAVGANERKSLIHTITANGWREDNIVWHVTSECASSVYEATNNILRTSEGLRLENRGEQERKVDLTELLGIAGVPTFLFIHPEGYIAWHGRYSAYDYTSFTAFMRHTISEVVAKPCPVYSCDCCQNDMAFDEEIFTSGILSPENKNSRNVTIRLSDPEDIPPPVTGSKHSPTHEMKYAAINGYTENAAGTERVFLRRRSSPGRSKRRTKLTVNTRPFSASASSQQLHHSPYLARLRPSSPTRSHTRPSSSKKLDYYV